MSIPTAGQGTLNDVLQERLDQLDAREAIQRVALALADLDLEEKRLEGEILAAFRKMPKLESTEVEKTVAAATSYATVLGGHISLSIALDYIYDALMGETND